MAAVLEEGEHSINLDLVHQHSIPSVWNKVKLDTFPENFVVLGYVPGDSRREMLFVQGIGGPVGLSDGLRMFQIDEVQYCGFRVTVTFPSSEGAASSADEDTGVAQATPRFVLLRWIGRRCSEVQRENLESDFRFMQSYFKGVHAVVHAADVVENENYDEDPMLTEQRRRITLERMAVEALCAAEPRLRTARIDFSNRGDVEECTHYDDFGESSDAKQQQVPAPDFATAVSAAGAAKEEAERSAGNGETVQTISEDLRAMLSDPEIAEGLQDPTVMSVLQGLMTGNFDATSMTQAMQNPRVERVMTRLFQFVQDDESSAPAAVGQVDGGRELTSAPGNSEIGPKYAEDKSATKRSEDVLSRNHLELMLSRLQLAHTIDSLKAEVARKEAQRESQDRLQVRLANRRARRLSARQAEKEASSTEPVPSPPSGGAPRSAPPKEPVPL